MNKKRIVVYKCEGDKYFVGSTEHDGKAVLNTNKYWSLSAWLQLYHPIEIVEFREYTTKSDVDNVVMEYMKKFGIDSTRGSTSNRMLSYIGSLEGIFKFPRKPKRSVDIEELVQQRLNQILEEQSLNVRPVEQLYTSTHLAKLTTELSAVALNKLIQNEGLHEPYLVDGTQYWRTTAKGKASPLIDDVPIGTGTITTTRFTMGIFKLPSVEARL